MNIRVFHAAVMHHGIAGSYWGQTGLGNKINGLIKREQIGKITHCKKKNPHNSFKL
jgi:hypothetical protein